ncbi:scavenger receptor class B member 1-like [Trichoplusia ni]|uniref:Scavenger receptor class B member 1-like n=1 Tax=Trichoplusia ni TaxID=7111 RepID=A0A7E5WGY5_TRINI|nr:scavenger receptor class B member 1-like [Trichoplusia ni]
MSVSNMLPEDSASSGSSSEDTESTPVSATDSLNSLFKNTDNNCVENCMEEMKCEGEKKKGVCCSPVVQCVWGVLLILLSVGSFIFTPLDFMLLEKLNMRPGMPPYEWWADPPDEVKLRAYVFNITNHERFMLGLDDKLNVEEIGPVVYLEKLLHQNVKFNENSTMTYTAKRYPIYLPEQNHIDLNQTIVVPNVAVLGILSYLHDANYFVRTVLRSFLSMYQSEPFVKKTIYEYLWNYTDPVLDMSKSLVPGLVPVNNAGMLDRIYSDFTDEMTVKVGSQWGHKEFFQIDRFHGEPQLPGFDPEECPDRIFGSTEGVMYAQRLTKEDVLLYWRKTVCKLMPLYFDSELTMHHVPLYRYNLSESVFDRVSNGTDCYDTDPSLHPGLSDASKCYFNFPMVVSFPHFYVGGVPKDHFVTGLTPDRFKHNSFVILEPYTGTPFEAVARMQSNLRINDLSGYDEKFAKLSNTIIPLFWGEYHQEGLPSQIKWAVYFVTVILPPLSIIISSAMLLLGLYLIVKQIYINNQEQDSLKSILIFKSKNLRNSKIFAFEKESFIKSS